MIKFFYVFAACVWQYWNNITFFLPVGIYLETSKKLSKFMCWKVSFCSLFFWVRKRSYPINLGGYQMWCISTTENSHEREIWSISPTREYSLTLDDDSFAPNTFIPERKRFKTHSHIFARDSSLFLFCANFCCVCLWWWCICCRPFCLILYIT